MADFNETETNKKIDVFAGAMKKALAEHTDRGNWEDKNPREIVTKFLEKTLQISRAIDDGDWEMVDKSVVNLANYSAMMAEQTGLIARLQREI